MKKKALSLVLALVMCLGLMVPAFAAGTMTETVGGITVTANSNGTISYAGTGAITEEHMAWGFELLYTVTDGTPGAVTISIGSGITNSPDKNAFMEFAAKHLSDVPASITVNSSAVAQAVGGFNDVKESDYFVAPVLWAVEKGITAGTSATTFSPNQNCTVAQIISFLWRANGSPRPTGSNPFSDVKESDYYYSAALWAAEKGIVTGGTFGGNSPCTRSMAVTYMWKAAGGINLEFATSTKSTSTLQRYKGNASNVVIPDSITTIEGFGKCNSVTSVTIPTSVTSIRTTAFTGCDNLTDVYYEGSEAQWKDITIDWYLGSDSVFKDTTTIHYNSKIQPVKTSFTDVPAGAEYAKAVNWAVEKGVTAGISATAFSPDSVCTRGQIVTFLYRDLAK